MKNAGSIDVSEAGFKNRRVDGVGRRIGAREVDADRPVEHAEEPAVKLRALLAEDGCEVLVGQLDDLINLVVPDALALGVERVVVARIEVLTAERELVEARRTLLGRHDDAAVPHEVRVSLHVEQERELRHRAAARVVRVEVRVELRRVGRGVLRAAVVDVGLGGREVAARRGEHDATVGGVRRVEVVNQRARRQGRAAGGGGRWRVVVERVLRAARPGGAHLVDRKCVARGRAARERELRPVPAHGGSPHIGGWRRARTSSRRPSRPRRA